MKVKKSREREQTQKSAWRNSEEGERKIGKRRDRERERRREGKTGHLGLRAGARFSARGVIAYYVCVCVVTRPSAAAAAAPKYGREQPDATSWSAEMKEWRKSSAKPKWKFLSIFYDWTNKINASFLFALYGRSVIDEDVFVYSI